MVRSERGCVYIVKLQEWLYLLEFHDGKPEKFYWAFDIYPANH